MWILLTLSILTSAPPTFEAQALDGRSVVGTLSELDADHLVIDTVLGPVSIPLGELTVLVAAGPRSLNTLEAAVGIDLWDGSSLLAADYQSSDDTASIITPVGETLQLPLREVTHVRLQPATEPIAAEWERILQSDSSGDLLVIRKSDSIDYLQGVVISVSESTVEFELDGDILPVKRSKVFGLKYYRPPGRDLPDSLCRLFDTDGSQWLAQTISSDGQSLHWTTPGGVEVARPLDSVARIDFSEGKVVYLGDLEPEAIAWTPYFSMAQELPSMARLFGPRGNRGLRGGLMRLDGIPYDRGIALHSRTVATYRLDSAYHRFKAIAGIDDRVRPRGNVRFVISGDGRELFAATITGSDAPLEIDVDLTGVRRLTFEVDFGEDLGMADHLDLCEARIVK